MLKSAKTPGHTKLGQLWPTPACMVVGSNLLAFADAGLHLAKLKPASAQIGAKLAQQNSKARDANTQVETNPMLVASGPILVTPVDLLKAPGRADSPNLWPNSTNVGPNLTTWLRGLNRSRPELSQLRWKLGSTPSHFCTHVANFNRSWPDLRGFGADVVADVVANVGPGLANVDRCWSTSLWPSLAKVCQLSANVGQFWPTCTTLANIAQTTGQHCTNNWPRLVEAGQSLATVVGTILAEDVGQCWFGFDEF